MSKTVTIPSDKGNPVTVVINRRKYTYKAGTTVSVPDEVAALLEANDGNSVIYGRRATAPLEAPVRKGSNAGVPVNVDDNGGLYANAEDIAATALEAIYVEGHKLVIPDGED